MLLKKRDELDHFWLQADEKGIKQAPYYLV